MQRLREEMELANRKGDSVSVFMVDGDMMKTVNDRYGHADGNRVLIEITAAMRSALRVSDVLGRFGGDEFIVVLPSTNATEAIVAAERLRKAVATHDYRNSWGERINATVSVGVATYPVHATNAEDLFRAADRSLYQAKQDGRDRVRNPDSAPRR